MLCHRHFYFILFLAIAFTAGAQENAEIKIRKEKNTFYFYQLGQKNDTIIKNKTDKFYLTVPDTLDCNIQISLTNGRLAQVSGNTYMLIPIKNMSYSHYFCKSVFDTQLEGTREMTSTAIEITIIDTKNNRSLITNKFIVR